MINIDEQKRILENYVLPLFSGAKIVEDKKPSSKQEQIVALSNSNLMIKFYREDTERYEIKRSQPFDKKDVSLVKRFIQGIADITILDFYADTVYGILLEKAICETLSEDNEIVNTIKNVIDAFTNWSLRTYEGKRLSFGIIIEIDKHVMPQDTNEALKTTNYLNNDYSAPLSDGISSCFTISKNGYLLRHDIIRPSDESNLYAPYRFIDFAAKCNNGNIGLILLANGEILIFANKEMLYSKRQGKWRFFDHETAIKRLSDGSKSMDSSIREAMYLTALDVSFSKTGGCVGYINKVDINKAIEIIKKGDLIDSSEMNGKAILINKLVDDEVFQKLHRKMRQELAGIDGAIVIDNEGKIITCGAILQKVNSSVEGGGRLAATIELSKYGVAIKISADGGITAFHKEKKIVSVG